MLIHICCCCFSFWPSRRGRSGRSLVALLINLTLWPSGDLKKMWTLVWFLRLSEQKGDDEVVFQNKRRLLFERCTSHLNTDDIWKCRQLKTLMWVFTQHCRHTALCRETDHYEVLNEIWIRSIRSLFGRKLLLIRISRPSNKRITRSFVRFSSSPQRLRIKNVHSDPQSRLQAVWTRSKPCHRCSAVTCHTLWEDVYFCVLQHEAPAFIMFPVSFILRFQVFFSLCVIQKQINTRVHQKTSSKEQFCISCRS